MIVFRTAAIAALFASTVTSGPASALDAGDTLTAWKSASIVERQKLVAEILKRDGRESGASGVIKCLDAAASISGHAGLTISRVVEVCEKEQGEPV